MQELLQPLVQDLPLTLRQLIVRKPHALLPCLPPAKAHDASPTQFDRLRTMMPCLKSFSTGCYEQHRLRQTHKPMPSATQPHDTKAKGPATLSAGCRIWQETRCRADKGAGKTACPIGSAPPESGPDLA